MPENDLTLIPSDEAIDLQSPIDNIDADDVAIINAQAVIEKSTLTWQQVFVKLHNFEVNAYFEKQNDDSLPLESQKDYFTQAVLMSEDDGGFAILGKDRLFTRIKGLDLSALNEVYLLPPSEVANINLRDKPKLKLYFVETNYLTDSGREIADGQIAGIRLVEFTSETIKRADGVALGEKIRDTFSGFIWQKGKGNLSYSDPEKGYNIQILYDTREGGLEVLTKVLSLRDHEVESKRITFNDNEAPTEAFPDTQQTVQRLEKSVKTRVRRPVCTVKLRAAFLYIDSLIKPEVLYDNSGYYPNPYVTDGS
ncbi:hypothetical protein [Pseudanabaena sp. UWO310]|uniref:hypothetical protein n=1 Tax=Pseudanabaena sp. UWO310 TaxID=2480795 RepID=UPI0011571BF9|nr:hypothetical protein [Pseudanabaena sp. UWO310]TYQ29967.1 hypothetical protein PseudUWO310_11140 [Pseudanabaena sp. UWO310]